MNVTKNQHYVCRGILKHFSDEQNKTFELFIEKQIVSKKYIEKTMSQNLVYEHSNIEINTIENLFARVESEAIPLIDELIDEIEKSYKSRRISRKIRNAIKIIVPYILLFYFRSGALLEEYSMDAENVKNTRVERMISNIGNEQYLSGLTDTICNHYEYAIIVDEEERFLISDQYLSTVALKFKNRFINASNRQIGMKETMILLPLTSKFYIVFFSGHVPVYIRSNTFSILKYDDIKEINNVIFKNSYVKCVGKNENELKRVKDNCEKPTKCLIKYKDNTIQSRIIKKEVFLYDEDENMKTMYIQYIATYMNEIRGKIKRNDKCICGSGIKYKKCCMKKYENAARILRDNQNPEGGNYIIPGVMTVEDSILEYTGPQEKMKNKKNIDIIEKIFKDDK